MILLDVFTSLGAPSLLLMFIVIYILDRKHKDARKKEADRIKNYDHFKEHDQE